MPIFDHGLVAPVRTVFIGNNVSHVQSLQEHTNLLKVYAASREGFWLTRFYDWCEGRGIQPTAIGSVNGNSILQAEFEELAPDVVVCCGYNRLIPGELFSIARYGSLNVHPSLLPKYRGQHVIQWSIINGENQTGVTVHQMDAKFDEGPIWSQQTIPIADHDTAYTLHEKLSLVGSELVLKTLGYLNTRRPKEQDHNQASYYRARTLEDGVIDLNRTAEEVRNLVRALVFPWPGASLLLGGRVLTIESAVVRHEQKVPCGEVVERSGIYLAGCFDKDIALYPRCS